MGDDGVLPAITCPDRWAMILAEARDVRWSSRSGAIPAGLIALVVREIAPHVILMNEQHRLVADPHCRDLDRNCYLATRDGAAAAAGRARELAREDAEEEIVVLVLEVGGSALQAINQTLRAAGTRLKVVAVATADAAAPVAPRCSELAAMAHRTWGHWALATAMHVTAMGRPWSKDSWGSRFAQMLLAGFDLRPDAPRTVEAPLWRARVPCDTEWSRVLCVAAQKQMEQAVLAALYRAQAEALGQNLRFGWWTRHYRPGEKLADRTAEARPVSTHVVAIGRDVQGSLGGDATAWGHVAAGILDRLRDACDTFDFNLRQAHRGTLDQAADAGEEVVRALGERTSGEPAPWCVTWSPGELVGAVHVPVDTDGTCAAVADLGPAARCYGAKAVVLPSGIALIGLAPGLAEAALRRRCAAERGLHCPRRLAAHEAPLRGAADVRLVEPTAGHDLTWMVVTQGQIPPAQVARAVRGVLGEAPVAVAVNGYHPNRDTFEQMVQVTVPAHLERGMRLGPAAAGELLVGTAVCPIFPFTETRHDLGRRAPGESREARMLREAVALGRGGGAHTTMHGQPASTAVHDARGRPIGDESATIIPIGLGAWRGVGAARGATPAGHTMHALQTHVALAL